MDWTDRHCRVFHRTFSRRARLYSEMVTTGAIIHGPRQRLLGFDPSERSLALQLGGSDPKDLALCAKIGEDFGYDEISATDVLHYVASIFARGDVKNK